MPPKKAAKKAPTKQSAKAAATAASRQAKKEAEAEALRQWIASNDPLLDPAAQSPIRLDDLFNRIVTRKTFTNGTMGQVPYDWSAFVTAVEARSASSPRWFVQLREEDLLAGADGMEGVTVNCFVVAETSEPTLSPAEYVVKVHWPYSDAEDNAPERILPISGQGMCWQRVVKNDGSDVNMYLLQKRDQGLPPSAAALTAAATFGFGLAPATASAPSAAAAPAAPTTFGFGFGASANSSGSGSNTATAPAFGFGFGQPHPQQQQQPAAQNAGAPTPVSFGFGAATAVPLGTAPAPPTSAFGFGFGSTTPAATVSGTPATTAAGSPSSPQNADEASLKAQPLKTSEVLFCLWSKKRLTAMAQEVKSGSRIVREQFPLDASGKAIKLVMENDRKDNVQATVKRLIMNRLFAKQDNDVAEMDKWINDCPVYDEELTAALQNFREQHVNEIAEESEEFAKLYNMYHGKMEAELQRIVEVRARAAQDELDAIENILERIKEGKLAEKASFRLLKYYPKNDIQKFRPFGKVSGISEMGESVDLCEPPAHVNINPFTGKPS